MRISLLCLVLCASCTTAIPAFTGLGLSPSAQNALTQPRRGQVEVAVKANFNQIIPDIRAGGGPALTHALEVAGVPVGDRPARVLQLQTDVATYANSPGALVNALTLYGA